MKKYLIKNIFYITIPLVLSYITSFLVNIDLPILIIIFYGILLFFLIPSEVYLGSTMDYNAKVVNPTYRPENKSFEDSPKSKILSILIVLLCLILTISIWYFTITFFFCIFKITSQMQFGFIVVLHTADICMHHTGKYFIRTL